MVLWVYGRHAVMKYATPRITTTIIPITIIHGDNGDASFNMGSVTFVVTFVDIVGMVMGIPVNVGVGDMIGNGIVGNGFTVMANRGDIFVDRA